MEGWLRTQAGVQVSSLVNRYSLAELVTDGLALYLDAGLSESYPGTGTVWYDLSGNSRNFNIVSTAWNSSGYMNFGGGHGTAKNSSDISLSDSTGVTYYLITRVLNSTSNWRTLTRSYTSDHHIIIQSGAWNLGMYDNDSVGFVDFGYSQQSFPNYGTSNWLHLYFRWQSTSPYCQMSFNDTPGTIRASTTNSNARYNRGFGSIGGYHDGSTTPSSSSQFWGDIAVFTAYNRYLTDSELLQNYSRFSTRYST